MFIEWRDAFAASAREMGSIYSTYYRTGYFAESFDIHLMISHNKRVWHLALSSHQYICLPHTYNMLD